MRIKQSNPRPGLTAAIKRSIERFDSLTPEQQQAYRYEQKRSWARGEMGLEHPEMTNAEIAALVDRALPPLKDPTP